MSDLSPSGTPEQERMSGKKFTRDPSELEPSELTSEVTELLSAYGQWLAVAGRSAASRKDHTIKLAWFWRFLEGRGLLREGRVALAALDRNLLADYQLFVFELVSPHTGQRLACHSQINVLSYLQTFFRFLEHTGRLAMNPAEVIRLPRAPQVLPPVLLSPEQMRQLLAAPDVRTVLGFRDRTILEVLWSSAPRLGELVRLTVEDLNLSQGLLTIREGKGDKERVLPLGQGARAWLTAYLREVRPFLWRKERPCAAVFISKMGRAMDKTGWMKKLEVYLRRARIKTPFHSHGFRHLLASEMLRHGADLRHIQQMLGHENLSTTQRYLQVVQAELRRVHQASHPQERVPLAPVAYRGSLEGREEVA
jgi:integrase/recombinase XerD